MAAVRSFTTSTDMSVSLEHRLNQGNPCLVYRQAYSQNKTEIRVWGLTSPIRVELWIL